MKKINIKIVFIVAALCLFCAGLFFVPGKTFSYSDSRIDATIRVTVCGNLIIESGEECDQTNLAGRTCTELGYAKGSLSCYSDCTLNKTGCSSGTTGGGGGGGGGPTIQNSVIITGRAYPLSKVTVLKDGQLTVETIAGPDAKFSVSIADLSPGNYLFSVFGEDKEGRKSALFSFSVKVTAGATTSVGGVFIPPTIAVDHTEVKQGENIAIFGRSTPESEITIKVNSSQEMFFQTDSDKDGVYLYNLDTTPLEKGQHETRSKARLASEISNFGEAATFKVGDKTVTEPVKKILKGDLNKDGKVNLVDFSIAAYWYKRKLTTVFKAVETERLNNDGKINLTDFSIMAYYWTG